MEIMRVIVGGFEDMENDLNKFFQKKLIETRMNLLIGEDGFCILSMDWFDLECWVEIDDSMFIQDSKTV